MEQPARKPAIPATDENVKEYQLLLGADLGEKRTWDELVDRVRGKANPAEGIPAEE